MPIQLRYAFSLMCVCVVGITCVAGVYSLARPNIQKNASKAEDDALAIVLKGAARFQAFPEGAKREDVLYYIGYAKDDAIVGYAAKADAQGYSSKPVVMVGVSPDLKTLLALSVISQAETPGLGARAEEKTVSSTWMSRLGLEEVEDLTEEEMLIPWFQKRFYDKSYEELVVTKTPGKPGITPISGATITSNAIIEATKTAWNSLQDNLPKK